MIDTTPPVVTERLVTDTGLSNTDKITSNPSLTGVGDPYAIVTLTEGSAVLGTTRTDGLGAWTFTPTGLPDGAHTVVVTESVTDTAGNAGTGSLSFTLDTAAPVAPAAVALDPASDTGVPGDGITNATRPAITGTGTPGNKVTLFDAGVAVGTVMVAQNGTFSIAPTNVLPDGLHNLTTTQTNPAGNQSPGSAVVSLIIVTAPPAAISALALDPGSNSGVPGGNTTNVTQPVITGSGVAGDVLTLYDNGIAIGTTIVASNGTFATSPSNPLANGPHSLTATQTDGIGNISALSSPLALTIDTIAPQPPSAPILTAGSDSGVPGDGITNVAIPVIAGTAEAGSVVQLYDGTTAIGTAVANPITGAWSIIATSPLSEGPDSLTATSTDAAGNVSTLSGALNVMLDTVAPAVPTLVLDPASDSGMPGDGITSVTNPLITGAAEAGSTVRLYDGVLVVGVGTADPVTGAWSIAPTTPLAEGPNSLTATSTDAAGNVSALSGPISVMLDTIAPLAPTLSLSAGSDSGVFGDGITNVATPTLSGTAERGSTVHLYNGAIPVGATVADPLTGAWSVALTGALSEGANSLTASSVDTAGNLSARSAPLNVTLDTAAPTVSMVAATPSTADLGIGGVATLTLTMSKAVTVTTASGTPTLSLSDGGTASYISGSGTTALLFGYTVLPGQNAADLAVTGSSLNGSAIADVAGNAADLAAAQTNPAGVLQVDTVVPTVTSVTAVPGVGAVGAGQVVTLRLGMSKTVSVTGTPTLSLNDGGVATYDPAASTANSLAFITTVAPGQNALNLGITATNLNGATLTDAAGNLADLSAAPGSLAGPLQVDTTPPAVNSMTSSPASGTLAAGQTVTFTLGTTKNVAITGGTPTLALNDGGVATYDAAASGPNNLVFDYTVGPVDNTESLAVTGAGLHGAAILDEAGNALDLTSAANFPLTLQVDTITPLVSGVSFSPTDGPVLTGQTVTLRLATNDAVTVAGGIPTLTLSDGGVATYNPAASTATSLAFVYTVGSSDASPALGVGALNLNGAVIANGAGTSANLAGAVGTIPNTLVINTGVHPFLPLVSSNPDPAAILTVKAAVLASNGGSYGNLGIGSIGADGFTYTVTGTAAQVNAALAGVLLVRPAGGPPVTGLTATVSDQNGSLTSRLSNTGVFGSTLVATAPGETVSAGMGPDTLTAGASGNVLVGGAGQDVLVGSNGGGTLLGGTGQSVFFSVGGPTRIVGGSIGDTISAAAGDVTIVTSMAGHSLVGLGSGTALVNGQGADTIVGGSGSAVVGAGANSLVGLTVGSATVSAADGSTVITGSGPALVAASNTGILMFQGPGAATFIGGSGASTVVGGSGSHGAFFGGTGGGLFSGGSGGNNVIVGGQQATTILGGGGGDLMFAVGAAGTVITAGTGNETLQGGYSTGNDTFFAGPGQDLIGLGSGHDVVFAGSGAATIIGGSGQDVVAFANGRAGGTDTLYNFKPGTDAISLQGYAVGEAAHALAGATTTPSTATQAASVTVTLSDKTQITFQGIGSLNAHNFT